jgi:hypothetical protein
MSTLRRAQTKLSTLLRSCSRVFSAAPLSSTDIATWTVDNVVQYAQDELKLLSEDVAILEKRRVDGVALLRYDENMMEADGLSVVALSRMSPVTLSLQGRGKFVQIVPVAVFLFDIFYHANLRYSRDEVFPPVETTFETQEEFDSFLDAVGSTGLHQHDHTRVHQITQVRRTK